MTARALAVQLAPLLLSRRQAARVLQKRVEVVSELVRAGLLPEVSTGTGRPRIPYAALVRLAETGWGDAPTPRRVRRRIAKAGRVDPDALRKLDLATLSTRTPEVKP